MDIKPVEILTSPVAKEIAKTFALSVAASTGSLVGMGLVFVGYDKVEKLRAKKLAKKTLTIESE